MERKKAMLAHQKEFASSLLSLYDIQDSVRDSIMSELDMKLSPEQSDFDIFTLLFNALSRNNIIQPTILNKIKSPAVDEGYAFF